MSTRTSNKGTNSSASRPNVASQCAITRTRTGSNWNQEGVTPTGEVPQDVIGANIMTNAEIVAMPRKDMVTLLQGKAAKVRAELVTQGEDFNDALRELHSKVKSLQTSSDEDVDPTVVNTLRDEMQEERKDANQVSEALPEARDEADAKFGPVSIRPKPLETAPPALAEQEDAEDSENPKKISKNPRKMAYKSTSRKNKWVIKRPDHPVNYSSTSCDTKSGNSDSRSSSDDSDKRVGTPRSRSSKGKSNSKRDSACSSKSITRRNENVEPEFGFDILMS